MDLYDSQIRDKYYSSKRKLKKLLNDLQTADDGLQISNIHIAIDEVICDMVAYKHYDLDRYNDIRKARDEFYMLAASMVSERIKNNEET